jgi:hypothetical protein
MPPRLSLVVNLITKGKKEFGTAHRLITCMFVTICHRKDAMSSSVTLHVLLQCSQSVNVGRRVPEQVAKAGSICAMQHPLFDDEPYGEQKKIEALFGLHVCTCYPSHVSRQNSVFSDVKSSSHHTDLLSVHATRLSSQPRLPCAVLLCTAQRVAHVQSHSP